jgi:four helix bundle protein
VADFKRLQVWQLAHATRLRIYRSTARYPREEMYRLADQTRRAASSVTSCIAEGSGRPSDADYARFIGLAIGSVNELEDHLLLARDLDYITRAEWGSLIDDVSRVRQMLVRFHQRLTRGRVDPSGRV